LSKTGIEEGRIALTKHYRECGYLYAKVLSDIEWEKDNTYAQVVYHVQEGPLVSTGNVLIRGLNHTRKNTVLSRLSLKKGEVFHHKEAFADQRSLLSLGVFSNVRIKLMDEDISSEKKDVLVDVTERNRHVVEISPGVSTADGVRLRTVYTYLNVLGTGSSFTGSLKLNRQMFFGLYGKYASELKDRYDTYQGMQQLSKALEREVRLGLRLPPWTSLPLSPVFRFDVLNERDNALNYSLETAAFIAGADVLLPLRMQLSYETQVSMTDLECVRNEDCSGDVRGRRRSIDMGRRWMVKTGPYFTYDRRDNPLSPSKGWYANVKTQFAWGAAKQTTGDPFDPFKFMRLEGILTGYVPMGPLVLALSARVGALRGLGQDTVIPLDERFFLGGRDTLRGYMEGSLVPQDVCVLPTGSTPVEGCVETLYTSVKNGKTSPPLSKGGHMYALMKSELRLPITGDVSFNVFADVGNLWVNIPNKETLVPRFGVGAGLRYATPVGAVTFDVGVNPSARVNDRAELRWQYHLSIGTF
jgi:outer membrane protein insertion porin family